jgi:hypothetical protein
MLPTAGQFNGRPDEGRGRPLNFQVQSPVGQLLPEAGAQSPANVAGAAGAPTNNMKTDTASNRRTALRFMVLSITSHLLCGGGPLSAAPGLANQSAHETLNDHDFDC